MGGTQIRQAFAMANASTTVRGEDSGLGQSIMR
jgi:hypothetical protein